VGVPGGTIRGEKTHERIVKKALAEGKIVPPEVIAEYPDLQAKAPDVGKQSQNIMASSGNPFKSEKAAKGHMTRNGLSQNMYEPVNIGKGQWAVRKKPEYSESDKLIGIEAQDANVNAAIREGVLEERKFAEDEQKRIKFIEGASKTGNSAQAADIIGGGIERIVDDIGKGRITAERAIELHEDAVKQGIAIPERFDKLKRLIANAKPDVGKVKPPEAPASVGSLSPPSCASVSSVDSGSSAVGSPAPPVPPPAPGCPVRFMDDDGRWPPVSGSVPVMPLPNAAKNGRGRLADGAPRLASSRSASAISSANCSGSSASCSATDPPP
jgi:hypothetical protein